MIDCFMFDILKASCEGFPQWLKFIEYNKKDIRFTGYKDGIVEFNVKADIHIKDSRSVQRISNIQVPKNVIKRKNNGPSK